MFYRSYRRSPLRRYGRPIPILLAIVCLLDLFLLLNRYKTFEHNLSSARVQSTSQLPPAIQEDKILICAQFWTSAQILVQHWNDDLIALVQTLGPQNVYVSVYESGSLDNTKDILQKLDTRLNELHVQHRVVLDPSTHADAVSAPHDETTPGWIHTPRSGDDLELRRIPYLAKLRNKVLEPLSDPTVPSHFSNTKFSKILFLNDVHFTSSDILTLLSTNNGDYAATCSLDFMLPPRFYDTFVLRDELGLAAATEYFPFFRSFQARKTLTSGLPVPVTSCWNGVVAMDAAPFYPDPSTGIPPVSYRGIDDALATKSIEGSECCLVHADLLASGLASTSIFLNPAVRVGYSRGAYDAVHDPQVPTGWLSATQYVWSIYYNRYKRLTAWGKEWGERRMVSRRLAEWEREGKEKGEERTEPGEYCLVHQMHTLIWNGWAHVWEDDTRNIPLAAQQAPG